MVSDNPQIELFERIQIEFWYEFEHWRTWNLSVPFDQVSVRLWVSWRNIWCLQHISLMSTIKSHHPQGFVVSSASTLKWNRSGSTTTTSNATFVQHEDRSVLERPQTLVHLCFEEIAMTRETMMRPREEISFLILERTTSHNFLELRSWSTRNTQWKSLAHFWPVFCPFHPPPPPCLKISWT